MFKQVRTYFILFLGISIVWFTYQMLSYPILPNKYLIPVLGVLYLIALILGLSQYKGNSFIKILGKIFILIIGTALLFINFTFFKTVDLFDDIVQSEDKDIISVLVKSKSAHNDIEDLFNRSVGVFENGDDYIDQTFEEYKNDLFRIQYDDMEKMLNDLMIGNIQSIMINESYRGFFEEISETFTEDTRVIYSKEYVTIIKEELPEVKPDGNNDENKDETEKIPGDDFADITINDKINLTQDTFSIYVSGIDTYGSISTKSRSDVNMIVTINPRERKILLTSIPRDYYIPFSVLNGAKDKLTHSGLYGVNETKKNVQNYFGVYLPYYVRVNFTSLVTIVDAIGGIDIYNPHEGVFDLPVGNVHINGKMALIYARERYSFKNGDGERIKNQARIITGIINKVTSPDIITNYSSLLSALKGSFQTNISDDQILSVIRMQLNDMRGWSIETQSVTGTGAYYYSPIYGSSRKLYMCVPNNASVEKAKDRIESMY